jgi:hypothetical protein
VPQRFLVPALDDDSGGGLPAGALVDVNVVGIVDINSVQIVAIA